MMISFFSATVPG